MEELKYYCFQMGVSSCACDCPIDS